MVINGYLNGGYLCLLMAIGGYSIGGYSIGGYSIGGYWWFLMVIH